MIQDSDLDSFLRSDTGSDEPAAAPKTGSAPPSAGSFTFNLKSITPEISQAFKIAADAYGVDENVLIGIAARESGFNPQAIGPVTKNGKRAVGLMMFMPDTANEYGIDPTDPIESVMAAAAYMRQSLDRFGGDYRKAIASYNWGRDRSEFDAPDWDKSLPKETSQYLAYVEQFIGADGEPAKGDAFGTARTEDRGFVPDVQDTSEMEAASKPYFGTSSPKSRRPQEESLSPTVVGPSAPEDLPTTSKAPVDPKVRAEIYAAWDAADPGKRAMMEAAPGWAGMLARERAGVFKRFDAGKTGVVEQFDPRREARSNRLVGAGENAIFADRAAKEAAASGIDPGNEVKFIQGQYGTIGTNRSPIGQMQDELAATRPGAKPEGVVEVASNAIMRGIHQNAGMGSALLAAGAKSIGADGLALDLLRSYFLRQIDAKKYPAQIEDFTKIDSLSDVPVYVLEGVLENAPQLVGTIGSSVIGATLAKKFGAKAVADMAVEQAGKELARRQAIGAAVGAGATSIGMETGSIYGDVAKDTGQERPGVAASFGVVAGALDAIPAFRAATKILGQDTSSFVAKEIFKRYGTEAVKQLRSEGGTEFLQTWIEEAAKTYVDGRPLLTAENLIQAIDAGLKGGLAGTVTGASSQGISDFRNRALIAVDDAAKKAKSDALNKWQSFADAGKRAPQERNAEAKIADISKAETIDEVAAKALEVVNTPVAPAASVTTAPDLAPTVDAITALENTNVSPSGDSGVVAAGAPASQADQSGPGVGAAGLTEPDTRGSGSVDTATADPSVPASGTVPQPGGESSPAVEPAKVWYGRKNDGYLTPEDAQRGLGERQRLQGQFDWRIEPTPDGKYRLAGYAPSTATGTVQASAPAYQAVNQAPITFRQGKGGSWFVGGDPATIRDLLRANGITNFLPTKDGAQLPANTDPEVIGAIRMMAEDFKNLSIQELKDEIRQRMGMTQPPKEPKQTRPFRDFLRSVGIRSDIAGDVVGESNRMRANQILPMTFRRNGLNLDALAERALEMGFLTQQDIDNPNDNGGVNRLVEMIKAESRGVRQAPIDEQTSVDAEQAQAEKELITGLDKLGVPASSYADLSVPQMNSMLNRIERRLRDARLRKQQLDVAEESRLEREAIQAADDLLPADLSAIERQDLKMKEATLEDFMRSMLFSEQEIRDELAKQANAAQSPQAPDEIDARGPQGSGQAGQGDSVGEGPRAEDQVGKDLFGAAPNASQQEANRIRQEREDRERAQQQSAPSPDEFALSGSDRAADVGAARGQGDLLAPSTPKPVRVTPQVASNSQLASFIGIAADSVERLRASDVYRVIDETPAQFRVSVAMHIKAKRPDLANEADEALNEIQPAPSATKDAQQAAPVSSREGQMNLAARAGRIATLKQMNDRLRSIAPSEAWADTNIESASNAELDKLQDQISAALVAAQRGPSAVNPLRAELEAMSGAELRELMDRMGLAGKLMTASERVDALLAEDPADVRAAMQTPAPSEPAQEDKNNRINQNSNLPDGATVTDGAGNPFRVHYQRNGLVIAHPIIDGKPVVSKDTSVRFWVDDRGGTPSGDNDRTDPIFRAVAAKSSTPADGVTRAVAGGQFGINGEWYEGGQILPTSEYTVKGEFSSPSGPRAKLPDGFYTENMEDGRVRLRSSKNLNGLGAFATEEEAIAAAQEIVDARQQQSVDTSVTLTPQQVLSGAGLVVEAKTSQRGKPYWSVTGNTREHESVLDALGFGKPFKMGGKWYRSVFDADPTERLSAALQGAMPEPQQARPSLGADESAIVLRQHKIGVEKSGAGWIVTGKSFDVKDAIKSVGGRWNGQAWEFKQDPTGELAYALKERGGAGGDGNNAGTGESDAEIARRREQREREDSRSDERGDAGELARLVGDDTKGLIRRGEKFGIPQNVLQDQILDIGMAVKAFAADKPLFLLSNEAGTGKTMVLGGIIRELRKRGESKFVYVTMNTDLIAQIKRDLADYGVDDVSFHTYSEMSNKGFDTQDAILIFDEAHNIKNVGAETARANKGQELIALSKFPIFASATLYENPVEARYLAATSLFDSVGGFSEWAKMYGAASKVRKFYNPNTGREQTEEIIYWPGRGKKEDGAAARMWLIKQGVLTQRLMQIDPGKVNVEFRRVPVEDKWVQLYQQVTDAYDAAMDAWTDDNGNPRDAKITAEISRHRENTIKRVLEAAKIPGAIKETRDLLHRGRNVVIFVETKADRTLGMWRRSEHFKDDTLYTYAQMQEMMQEWALEVGMARMAKEKPPARPFAEFIVEIAKFFDAADINTELPSTADQIVEAIGADKVAMYTGAVSNSAAAKNKADFMAGRKKVLVATMAKGGTGLSLHDTKGDRPTTQLNINLPWKATAVDQVSARVARYGLASNAEVRWLFAANIPWETTKLAPRVGARMRDMGAIVKGLEVKAAEVLDGSFDFEGDLDVKGGAAITSSPDGDIYARAKRMESMRRKADDTSNGFFETPFPLAALMANVAGVHAGQRLLEPSGGRGNLLRLLPDGVRITAVELRQDNREALQRLVPNAAITAGDFMEFTTDGLFDTVLMNPPFERVAGVGAQDVAHVQRAYDMLAPGGRMVAIMGEGAFFRDFKQEKAFREWLDDVGATVVQLPEGAFKQSGTGVRTRMVVIDKDGESGRTDLNLTDMEPQSLRAIEGLIPSREAVVLAESKLPDAAMPDEPPPVAEQPAMVQAQAAAVVQEAETIPQAKPEALTIEAIEETSAQEEVEQTNIADFGMKIGGARKDIAKPTGPRVEREADKRPGWARKYVAMPVSGQVSLSSLIPGAKKEPVTANTPGAKWGLFVGKSPFMQRIGRVEFDSEQAAVDFIPIAEVGLKHRVSAYKEGDKILYGIFRKMGERKRALVKGGFSTEEAAKLEMVVNPVAIIEHRFPFPERPWLDNVQRIGSPRRTGSVTVEQFHKTFGFRGGEFGNWNAGGDGQAVLNHAYDALLDLADVLGVPPRALSLNGELAVAFGARGHGGKGFTAPGAAHYERDYEVINLTKEQGAGSLAHEWFHALDHYLARLDNAASSEFVINERGDRVRNASKKAADDYLTGIRARRPQARKELIAAFREVVDALQGVPMQVPVNTKFPAKYLQDAKDSLNYRLADLRRSLTEGKYNRGNKVATAEQLAKWDALAERLRRGDVGQGVYIDPKGEVTGDSPRANRISSARESARVIVDMNTIYKSVVGRSFDKTGYDSVGARIKFDATAIKDRTEALATAERRAAGGETDTKTRTSEFYEASREIDEGRVSPYWSTPHEMGARGFEAFIMDKIAERAGRSDYLVYGAENRYYALMGMRPYPEGDERKRINEAFTKLFQTIQTKDDDLGNVAMFRRDEGVSGGMSVEAARKIIDAKVAKWKNAPRVVVVATPQDLPMQAPDDANGVYHQGTVYIVAGAHRSPGQVLRTLAHEAVAHYGLRGMLGDGYKKFLAQMQMAIKMGNKPLIAIRDDVRSRYDGLTELQEADEIAARAIEMGLDENGEFKTGFGWLKSWFAKIAQFLRELGILIPVSNLELQGMLVNAQRFVQGRPDGTGVAVEPAPAFARDGTIEVDGVQRPRTNSKGQQIHPTDEGLRNFWRWFGDSKVVAANGAPQVMYHGTGADFDAFSEAGFGGHFTSDTEVASRFAGVDNGRVLPVYLSLKNPLRVADHGGNHTDAKGVALALVDATALPADYLNDAFYERLMKDGALGNFDKYEANNLEELRRMRDALEAQGYDGIVYNNTAEGGGDAYIAFRGAQIKSATGNTGAFNAGNDDIAFSRGQPGLFDSGQWDVPETGRVDAIIQKFQDGRIDLKRAQDAIIESGKAIDEKFDARLAETLYAGRVAHRSENFIKGEVKELLERMARLNVPMTDLSDFLLARHAPERNKQIAKVNPDMPDGGAGSNSKGELMTTQAAKDYIAALPSETKLKMTTLAALVDKITKGTRELLVAEGLESRDSIQAWEGAYSNYVPLFKDEAQGVSHPIGQGMSVRGSASRRATGSTGEVTNMLAHVLMQREAAITRAEKNRVGLALYGLALSHPNKDFWTTIKPNMSEEAISEELEAMGVDLNEASQGMSYAPTIRDVDSKTGQVVSRPNPLYKNLPGAMVVRVNGEDRVLMFNQENERGLRLAQNLKNLDGLDIANETLQKIVGTPTRWIASVNTQYNPAFGLVNVTRDALGAMVNLSSTQIAGKQLQVAGHVPSAMAGIFQHMRGDMDGEWAKLYEQFQMDGGKTGFKEMFRTADERTKALQDAIDKVDRSKLDPREIASGLLSILDGFNTISENIVRLSAYKVALDSGLSRSESARLARELTVDFNRKGSHGTTMGMAYAFFNASVQGSARTIKAIQGPAGKSIILGGLALGAMQALMLAAAGYDDDEIPEWVKARGLVIPLGKDDQGKKKHAIIPLPVGWHVLPNTGRALTELALYGKRDMGTKIVNSVMEIAAAFSPMGGGNIVTDEGALKLLAPTVLDPIVDLATNTNFSGRKIEKDYRETDNRPGFQRAREGTIRTASGQAYISVSKAMNTLTGGTDYQRGLASPSPEQIRYVAQVVGGGLLREVEKVANMAMPTASQRDIKVTGIPLAGRFYGVADDEQTQSSRYYKNAKDIDKIESSLGAAKKAGDREAVAEMSKDPLAALVHYNNTVGAKLSRLNKMAVQTVNDRARTIQIDRDRTELMRSLNNEVIRMEEKADGPNLAQRMRR